MSHQHFIDAQGRFEWELKRVERLMSCSQLWLVYHFPRNIPKFTFHHQDVIVERAFLMMFTAWEEFLEESFILYVMGKKPTNGHKLRSVLPVKTRRHAKLHVLQGKNFVDWSPCSRIFERNNNFFHDPKHTCFYALRSVSSDLDEISDLRNSVAHRSDYSKEKFKTLARNKLSGSCPPNLTVGRFLMTLKPSVSPPTTFADEYLDLLRYASTLIIPP